MSPPAVHRTAEGPPGRRVWPAGARVALVAVAYFVLARLGLCFATVTANISPIWPPSGLALGALIIGGLRLWPGVAGGALAAALWAGAPLDAAVLMATGNALEPLVTVVLLRRWVGFRDDFERPRHVVGFILLFGLVGAPLSAVFGAGASLLAGKVGLEGLLAAGLTWWGGNFAGGLVLGPLLIAAHQFAVRVRPAAMLRELVGLLVLLVLVCGTVFVWGPAGWFTHPALLVLPFPLLVWTAWRFAIGGAALSLLLLGTSAVWGTALGRGPFAGAAGDGGFGHLLVYLVVVALTSLVLAAFNVEREQVVARLHQREWQLSEAQRIGSIGVWVWDLRTDRFELSTGALHILGETRAPPEPTVEAFLGRVHRDDRVALEEMLRRVQLSDRKETCDVRLLRPDATERQVTSACAALRDARGQAVMLLGTIFDITERKRAEDERAALQRKLLEAQRLESIGLLAGGIAHDFNNLLTSILGYASLLRRKQPEGSPAGPGLRHIEVAAERAADLCRQMLAYSGKGRVRVRSVDLNELVRGTLALAQTSLAPGTEKIGFLPGEGMLRDRADLLQLRQVLLNLVMNAAEALPETGGRVSVSTGLMAVDRPWLAAAYLAPELPEGDYAYLEVADDGCGIAPELQAKIFEPFFSTKFTGRGLGLAAVAGIVRAHGGAVRVASAPGQGATFRIVLPLAPAEPERIEPAGAVSGEPTPVGAVAASPLPWLVVDDEATVRQVAAEMLGASGVASVLAADGLQALGLFGADGRGFRAVLLDYSMPQLDGVETFRRLRQRRPDIPVVLMSGFAVEEALERFTGLGITGFLQKPFSTGALLTAVAAVSGGAKS